MKSLLILIILSLTLASSGSLGSSSENREGMNPPSLKERSFKVLKAKCNVCHEVKNKRRVFTMDNMDQYSKAINRQVFKFKRMPKGNEIKLNSEESEVLKKWILSQNKK